MSFLKNHPFAVEAFFDHSLVLTFALPKEDLAPLIPDCVSLDTFQDKWAFMAIALVQTRNLRPKGFPAFMGHDFYLIGYRIFVRYTTSAGKQLRGLYIIKSETDRPKMEFLGNIFTHYNYSTTDINHHSDGLLQTIESKKSNFLIAFKPQALSLPSESPFDNWQEARRFAGPLPFTFTYNEPQKSVLILEGVRSHWVPKPVEVIDYSFSFLDQLNLHNRVLASAFEIKNIPYYWKKGRIDPWK